MGTYGKRVGNLAVMTSLQLRPLRQLDQLDQESHNALIRNCNHCSWTSRKAWSPEQQTGDCWSQLSVGGPIAPGSG